jgi:ankyrin repeat protein
MVRFNGNIQRFLIDCAIEQHKNRPFNPSQTGASSLTRPPSTARRRSGWKSRRDPLFDPQGARIEQRANREPGPKEHNTALHEAARIGNVEAAKILLDHAASIEARNFLDETPLLTAIKNAKITFARYLLSRDANVFVCTRGGYTILHQAAISGNAGVVQFVLDTFAASHPRSGESGVQKVLKLPGKGKPDGPPGGGET